MIMMFTGTNGNNTCTVNATQNVLNTSTPSTGTSMNFGSQISSTSAATFSFNAGTASVPVTTSAGSGLFQFGSTAAPTFGLYT